MFFLILSDLGKTAEWLQKGGRDLFCCYSNRELMFFTASLPPCKWPQVKVAFVLRPKAELHTVQWDSAKLMLD